MSKNLIKILFAAVFVLCISQTAIAEILKVEALSNFSTTNPPKTIQLKLIENVLYNGVNLINGDILTGEVVNIKEPQRLKRDARFSFIPESYTDENGRSHMFSNKYECKYASPINVGGIAKNAALSVGSFFVKGLSIGVNAVQGAIENDEGNRLKSAGKNVYDNSPLSYVETGKELDIKKGDIFYLRFGKDSDSDNDND